MSGYKSKKLMAQSREDYMLGLLKGGTGDHLEDLTLMSIAYDRIVSSQERIRLLISGPGGIMEMKQTIANLEAEVERLNKELEFYLPSV